MIILRGTNNVYHLKKVRKYRKRTLIIKREGKKMTNYILSAFVALTLATAVYAQIKPNEVIYNAPVSAPVAPKQRLEVKADIIPVETPKETIERIAKEQDFKQSALLVKIAFCESSLKPLAVNKNTDGTSDYGLFQFNSIHKFGELPLDLEWSVKKAIEWIRAGKLHAWNASANCWKRKNLTIE